MGAIAVDLIGTQEPGGVEHQLTWRSHETRQGGLDAAQPRQQRVGHEVLAGRFVVRVGVRLATGADHVGRHTEDPSHLGNLQLA